MAIRAEEIEVDGLGAVDLDRDRLLVLRHQRGEDTAFDELYRRYHRRLLAYCQRRVGDRHVAEELAQEAFVRALRALPTFAGERRFYPWLVVIAQRLCIDHHRRAARVEPAAEVDTGSVEADHEALWASVDRRHLAAAVERLAPRHREILDLRERRGLSYQQIAAELEVPLTTIEALLHRARKALRREYAVVAGEDGVGAGRLVAFGGLAALVARAKGAVLALGPERLAPAAIAAMAGAATVGLLVLPGPGTDPTPESVVVEAGVGGPDAAPAALPPTTAAAVAVPVAPTTVAAPPPPPTAPGTTTAPLERPEPSLEVGPVAVFGDDAGQAYVDGAVEEMPVLLDLGLLRLGLDPAHLLGLSVEPDPEADPVPPVPGADE